MTQETHHATIRERDAGERLDKVLAAHLPALSRSRIQALIGQGQVRCAGATITDAKRKVKPGEHYAIVIPPVEPLTLTPLFTALDVIYEDDDLLIINKPAGMTVHPAPGHRDDTLVNALLAHCGESLSGIGGVARPGIVHRIDKDTSGLLVVAKHDAAHASLSAQLKDRSLKRTYFALVWGAPTPRVGSIEGNIGRSPRNRQKMALLKSGGKTAITHYRAKEILAADAAGRPLASLLECELETGRTHQIRVHLSHMGHPLLGDQSYGGGQAKPLAKLKKTLQSEAVAIVAGFNRQALHAAKLRLVHPKTREIMQFEAPMPADMETLMRSLRLLK